MEHHLAQVNMARLLDGVSEPVMARLLKDQWLAHFERPHLALWWVPVGHRPTVAESAIRLRSMHQNGPTPYAFSLGALFAKPVVSGQEDMRAEEDSSR